MTEEAVCKWFEGDDWQYESGWEKVQPLIRCKDCKHWKYEDSGTDGTAQGECDLMCIFSDGMFFCAGAERREE